MNAKQQLELASRVHELLGYLSTAESRTTACWIDGLVGYMNAMEEMLGSSIRYETVRVGDQAEIAEVQAKA